MRRITYLVIAIAVIATVGVLVKGAVDRHRLRRYLSFIQQQYSNQFVAIENEMRQVSTEDYDAVAAQARLFQPLVADEIYSAGWSFDGHHGWRSLKSFAADGFGTSLWNSATDKQSGRRAYFGRDFDGLPLVVVKGELPSALVLHDYELVFDRNAIDVKMKRSQPAP